MQCPVGGERMRHAEGHHIGQVQVRLDITRGLIERCIAGGIGPTGTRLIEVGFAGKRIYHALSIGETEPSVFGDPIKETQIASDSVGVPLDPQAAILAAVAIIQACACTGRLACRPAGDKRIDFVSSVASSV